MQWLKVILGGLIEVIWVIGLNNAHNFVTWLFTLVFIALSFYLMISASKQLPVGTVYAVFVGIGSRRYSYCRYAFLWRTIYNNESCITASVTSWYYWT